VWRETGDIKAVVDHLIEITMERASDAKSERKGNDVRVLFAREIFTRFLRLAKLLKEMVARDGIEPPTPAFSGPLTVSQKWFEINRISFRTTAYDISGLECLRTI
jgi:hypothetical protein